MEHENLGNVVQMLARLDSLHSAGVGRPEMAIIMGAEFPEPPGGGDWTPETVSRVLTIVESVRTEGVARSIRHGAPPMPARRAIAAVDALDRKRGRATGRSRSVRKRRANAVEAAAAVGASSSQWIALDADGDTWDRADVEQDGAGVAAWAATPAAGGSNLRRRPPASPAASVPWLRIGAGAVLVAAVAGAAFGAYRTQDGDGADVAAPTADSGESTEVTAPVTTLNPADTLAIRIEPEVEAGEDASGGTADNGPDAADGGLQPPYAIIRDDGKLHLEGSFPSQDDADVYIANAADVFGRDNIVEAYVVDPAAPEAEVSDVVLDKPVLFKTGTAEIDPEFIPFLEACGDVLKLNSHITMSVAAYTDSVGSADFNLELSRQRAQAIIDFYESIDVDQSQLIGTGFGETAPIADNETTEGRQENRRAVLTLLDAIGDPDPDAADDTGTDSDE
ncbi:MAG: OmpA family protein [Actinomycetota bacterium]